MAIQEKRLSSLIMSSPLNITISSRYPISLIQTVTSHGWVQLSPWKWDIARKKLCRTEQLNSGKVIDISLGQVTKKKFSIQTDSAANGAETDQIESIVSRWISIYWDPRPAVKISRTLDPSIASFIELGGGRFLRSTTFYEDFVKTICTVNANWSFTRRMVSNLVNQLGGGLFPTPELLIKCGEENLRSVYKLGFRAKTLSDLSSHMLTEGWIDGKGNLVRTDLKLEDFLQLRGVGPYSGNHLLMLNHDYSHIPIDSEVTSYCRDSYGLEPETIEKHFEKWGDYKFLGYKLHRIINSTKITS